VSSEARVAVHGSKFRIEWAADAREKFWALEFFQELKKEDRQRVAALFKRLANNGDIASREHFKCLGKRGRGLWEFKRFQIRFLGDYRPGGRFLIAHGVRKKKNELDDSDIEKAVRILAEHDERERIEAEKPEAKRLDRKGVKK
jgi:hypothetical protein